MYLRPACRLLQTGARRLTPRHGVATRLTSSHVVASRLSDVVIPDVNLCEFIWERIDEWPDKTAVECGVSGRCYSYAQLRAACRRFAGSLRKSGFRPGQTLAVVLPNTPEYAIALLGAVEAGMLVTTVNPGYVPAEIAKQFADSDPQIVVTVPEKHGHVMEAISLLSARNPGYKRPMTVVSESVEGLAAPRGAIKMSEMIDKNVSTEGVDPYYRVARDTPVVIPYSSGTTGLPKGVLLSHRNIVGNAVQLHSDKNINLLQETTGSHQDVLPAILPLYHIYGLVIILLSKLRNGAKVVTLPKFDPTTFLNVLKTQKPSGLYIVPPLVLFLGSSPAVTASHLESLRFVLSGAAPLGEKDVARFKEKAPGHTLCMQAYGLTETSPTVLHKTVDKTSKLASVGIPVPNTKCKIINPENGEALGPGQVGELCVHGPQNMVGYHNNPSATAGMIDKDGWLHTGDLGYFDQDEDFFIVDRLKELIKVKGFQVAPAELEEILRSHPGVLDAAVIGIPDSRSGELPLAYVVPKSSDSVSTKEVMEFVASQTSSHKHLAEVRIVSSIPKSAAGKILRKLLREEYGKEQHKNT